MSTIHIISHTHWDREWYLTFQQFRLKFVHLIDHLLDILERDPEFKYFLLDGQTILLDDYLFVRPEREQDLRKYINSGRILIGGFTFQHLLRQQHPGRMVILRSFNAPLGYRILMRLGRSLPDLKSPKGNSATSTIIMQT